MRRFIFALCLVLLASPALAAYYIRDGASGSTCADWGANACDQFPSLSSGATYYVADGSYSLSTITAANVTIKKATASDYGAGANWQSGYGDGQATFGGLSVYANGVTIDGATRNESNWADGTAYGFRVNEISSIDDFASLYCADTLTIRYVNAGGADGASYIGSEPDYAVKGTGYRSNCENWTIHRSYLHNAAHYAVFHANGFDGATVEYTRFQNAWGKETIRGQIAYKNGTIRHNQFYNACGGTGLPGEGCTAEIALWDGDAGNWDGNKIYGNWFFRDRDVSSGGTIIVGGDGGANWAGASASNTLIYNNTIAGFADGWFMGLILINGGSGNICRNNLWYQVAVASASCNTTSNNVTASSDPFVNYATANLHLSGATAAGYTLSSPYNMDMDGATRGGDGTWDVGAYEYGSGGAPPTGTPTLSARSLVWWVLLPIGSLLGMLVAVPLVGGWLIRGVFDGRSDRAGGMGGVGGGEDGAPVRPLAPGAVQAHGPDESRGEDLDPPVAVAHEHPELAAADRSPVVR